MDRPEFGDPADAMHADQHNDDQEPKKSKEEFLAKTQGTPHSCMNSPHRAGLANHVPVTKIISKVKIGIQQGRPHRSVGVRLSG